MIMCLCALLLTACDKNAHEGEVLPSADGGILNVGLQVEDTDIPVKVVHLFLFGADDKLKEHQYFENPTDVALQGSNLPAGHYTVIAVMNVPADFMPTNGAADAARGTVTRAGSVYADLPDISLADFMQGLAAASRHADRTGADRPAGRRSEAGSSSYKGGHVGGNAAGVARQLHDTCLRAVRLQS